MTVRFFLVRHAAAAQHPPRGGGDASRPLSDEGRAAFAAHARALAPALPLARIVASPFVRARETAELLAGVTGAVVVEDPALGSGASHGRDLLLLGRRLGAGTALVGHNPELAEALARAAGHQVPVPPGTVAAIDDDGAAFRVAWVRPVP